MRYRTLVGTSLLLIWSGQILAQTIAFEGLTRMTVASGLLVFTSEGDVPLRTTATLNRNELVAVLLQNGLEPHHLSSRYQAELRVPSSPSSVQYRFTSDAAELKYLFYPAVALRADIGEYHSVRPMWTGFIRSRSSGGPLHNTRASLGIGISF